MRRLLCRLRHAFLTAVWAGLLAWVMSGVDDAPCTGWGQ